MESSITTLCPNCSNPISLEKNSPNGNSIEACWECGYFKQITVNTDGSIKIDEHDEPYCAFDMVVENDVEVCGSIKSEQEFNTFVAGIVQVIDEVQSLNIKRYIDGQHIKTDLLTQIKNNNGKTN